MSFTETKRSEIKKYILRKVDDDDEEMIAKTVDAFGISTTSVKRYIESELLEGHIARNESALCGYMLTSSEKKLSYDISQISEREDGIVYQDILPLINVNERAERIWRYTLCEIFNNAIEHSEGDKVDVYILTNCLYTQITLVDNGVGIFRKVYEGLERFGYRDSRRRRHRNP